jgi:uncharacterized Fe-S cluster protein YjdI/CDGSH-type Zn-finger protein
MTLGGESAHSSSAGIDGAPLHVYAVDDITVTWDGTRCLHFAECVRGLPTVFEPGRKPWIDPSKAAFSDVADVIRKCPSGALQYMSAREPKETGVSPTSIEPTEWGPIVVRGRLVVATGDGPVGDAVEESRVALCACGKSGLAPYCDDSCRVDAARAHNDLPPSAT